MAGFDDQVSLRGLVDSDFDSPLRAFKGNFVGWETEPATGYDGTRVKLNFSDLDEVVAIMPFNFPTFTINMSWKPNSKFKSRFGYYADSLAAFLAPEEDIKDCKDRVMSLVLCDGLESRPAPKPIWNRDADTLAKRAVALDSAIAAEKDVDTLANLQAERANMDEVFVGGMVPTAVWVVVGVDGATASAGGTGGQVVTAAPSASTADHAAANLIGKDRKTFNAWAFADPLVRKDTGLQRAITDKSFINDLIQLGKVKEDENGVFQAVEVTAE